MRNDDPAQMKLRMPRSLKKWLEQEADTNKRSLSGQAVFCLERQRDQQAVKGDAPVIGPTEASSTPTNPVKS